MLIRLYGMQASPLHSWRCNLCGNGGALTYGVTVTFLPEKCDEMSVINTGFIQSSLSKFKDFSRTSKSLSNSFQGLNVNEKYLFKC